MRGLEGALFARGGKVVCKSNWEEQGDEAADDGGVERSDDENSEEKRVRDGVEHADEDGDGGGDRAGVEESMAGY
jgi:hypothetical protein